MSLYLKSIEKKLLFLTSFLLSRSNSLKKRVDNRKRESCPKKEELIRAYRKSEIKSDFETFSVE